MMLKLNGREKDSQISNFLFFLLLVMYTIAYNNKLRANAIVWYGISAAVIVYLTYIVVMRGTIHLNKLVLWCVAFYSFSIFSLVWAEQKDFFNPLKSMALIFVTVILLSVYLDTKKDLNKLMLINYIALVLCAVYILATVDRSALGEMRISTNMEGAWNSNDISVKMSAGLCLSMYFLFESKKTSQKILHILSSILFVLMIFYCGSRTGALMMMGIIVLYMLLKAKGAGIVKAIIGVVIALVAFYLLIMYYEPFYNVLGVRMEDAINGLFGESTDDGSFNWRRIMIESGWEWFTERPILGYGVDNFRFLLGASTGLETYSHNNFIEMLVNGGIVGFVIYYYIYFYVLKKLWKPAVKQKDPLAIAIFVMNFTKLIMQFSSITYYDTDAYTMLMLAFVYITAIARNNDNSDIAKNITVGERVDE